MSDDTSQALASIQESLRRKEKLSSVSADVENLKAAKPPEEANSGLVHSTPRTQSVSQLGNSEDSLTTGIPWSERMELESEE